MVMMRTFAIFPGAWLWLEHQCEWLVSMLDQMDDRGLFSYRVRDIAEKSKQDLGVFKAFHPTLDPSRDKIPKTDNEALYYLISGTVVFEFVFETLPQIIIQTANNFHIRKNWQDAMDNCENVDVTEGTCGPPNLAPRMWKTDHPDGLLPPEQGWNTFAIVSILVSLVVAFDSLYRQLIQVVCLKKPFGSFDIWSRGDVKTDIRDTRERDVDTKTKNLRSNLSS